jgi:mRNA-degrading endonuclease RelE of RelBE toxin-antitoxin system
MSELRYHPKVKKELKRIQPQLLKKIRDEYLAVIKENPTIGNS